MAKAALNTEEGRVALVTGANRGIGLEVARQLARDGFRTVLGARDAAKGEAAAERLKRDGASVSAVALDVDDPTSIDRLVRMLETEYGRLDVLVNNAGIQERIRGSASVADLDAAHEVLETNLFGAWRTTEACLPLLRRSPHPRVVNVSSGAGSISAPGIAPPAYCVSKAALNMLTRLLANELRSEGILVNSVCPGWVATDMGGPGGRPVADGASSVMWAALLPDDGPTGGFFRDGKPLAW